MATNKESHTKSDGEHGKHAAEHETKKADHGKHAAEHDTKKSEQGKHAGEHETKKSEHGTHAGEHETKKSEHGKHESKSASGEKGVSQEQVGSGKEKDPNNFANDKERASAAGKKGGHSSHG